jgi:uncharacterized membrane protein YeaQ/YmgE (transglycosylase-associated protein family)
MLFGLRAAWVLSGLAVGAIGRLVALGHAKMVIAATVLVGLAGSFANGVVGPPRARGPWSASSSRSPARR